MSKDERIQRLIKARIAVAIKGQGEFVQIIGYIAGKLHPTKSVGVVHRNIYHSRNIYRNSR